MARDIRCCKKGDTVMFIGVDTPTGKKSTKHFTIGKEYIASKDYSQSGYYMDYKYPDTIPGQINVKTDDTGRANGYRAGFFEMVDAQDLTIEEIIDMI